MLLLSSSTCGSPWVREAGGRGELGGSPSPPPPLSNEALTGEGESRASACQPLTSPCGRVPLLCLASSLLLLSALVGLRFGCTVSPLLAALGMARRRLLRAYAGLGAAAAAALPSFLALSYAATSWLCLPLRLALSVPGAFRAERAARVADGSGGGSG